MEFKDFELERWLPIGGKKCDYNLAGATPPTLRFKDLIDEFDLNRKIGYGYTKGSDELRERISGLYSSIDKENVVVTHGACEADFLILNYLLNKGDEMVLLAPTYLASYGIANVIGAKVKLFFLKEEDNYKLNVEELHEFLSKKTKVIFVTNPNNPTATKLSADAVKALSEIAEDLDCFLVFDEALKGLEIDGVSSPSPIDLYEKGVSTRSLSKLGLGGLRIGWVAANKEIVDGCWAVKDYTTLGISGLSEYLASIALKEENVERIIEMNRKNLRNRLKILNNWIEDTREALSLVPVEAGAAAFPRYEADADSVELAERLLEEERVLVSPGDYFLSPKHFRMNYAGHSTTYTETTFKAALDRISRFLKQIIEGSRAS